MCVNIQILQNLFCLKSEKKREREACYTEHFHSIPHWVLVLPYYMGKGCLEKSKEQGTLAEKNWKPMALAKLNGFFPPTGPHRFCTINLQGWDIAFLKFI